MITPLRDPDLDRMLRRFLEEGPDKDAARDKAMRQMLESIMKQLAEIRDTAGSNFGELKGDIRRLDSDVRGVSARVAILEDGRGGASSKRSISPPRLESIGIERETGSFELKDGTIIRREVAAEWKQIRRDEDASMWQSIRGNLAKIGWLSFAAFVLAVLGIAAGVLLQAAKSAPPHLP